MGRIINYERARRSKCTCYQVGETTNPGDLMCYCDGVIGTLNDLQDRLLCPERTVKPETTEMKRHHEAFAESVHAAQERYQAGEGKTFWGLVDEEMEKRE